MLFLEMHCSEVLGSDDDNGDNYVESVDYTVICVENLDSGQPWVRYDYSMLVISQEEESQKLYILCVCM